MPDVEIYFDPAIKEINNTISAKAHRALNRFAF